jgi:hypothetical protein
VRPVIERCRQPLEQALRDAGITAKQVEPIVFVGGPTRVPAVRAFLRRCSVVRRRWVSIRWTASPAAPPSRPRC